MGTEKQKGWHDDLGEFEVAGGSGSGPERSLDY